MTSRADLHRLRLIGYIQYMTSLSTRWWPGNSLALPRARRSPSGSGTGYSVSIHLCLIAPAAVHAITIAPMRFAVLPRFRVQAQIVWEERGQVAPDPWGRHSIPIARDLWSYWRHVTLEIAPARGFITEIYGGSYWRDSFQKLSCSLFWSILAETWHIPDETQSRNSSATGHSVDPCAGRATPRQSPKSNPWANWYARTGDL